MVVQLMFESIKWPNFQTITWTCKGCHLWMKIDLANFYADKCKDRVYLSSKCVSIFRANENKLLKNLLFYNNMLSVFDVSND